MSTRTRPWVRASASFLKCSAASPFGVSSADTWLNLITIGAGAAKPSAPAARASSAAANLSPRTMDLVGKRGTPSLSRPQRPRPSVDFHIPSDKRAHRYDSVMASSAIRDDLRPSTSAPGRWKRLRWVIPATVAFLLVAATLVLVALSSTKERGEAHEQVVSDTLLARESIRFQVTRESEALQQVAADVARGLLDGDGLEARLKTFLRRAGEVEDMVPWSLAQEYAFTLADVTGTARARRAAVGPGRDVYTHQEPLELFGTTLLLGTNSVKGAPDWIANVLRGGIALLAGVLMWSLWALWRGHPRRLAAQQPAGGGAAPPRAGGGCALPGPLARGMGEPR